MNLILLTVILGCAVAVCLGVIAVMICLCKAYRDEAINASAPLEPPVKSWADAYFEVRHGD